MVVRVRLAFYLSFKYPNIVQIVVGLDFRELLTIFILTLIFCLLPMYLSNILLFTVLI